jgi:O-antigen ligase
MAKAPYRPTEPEYSFGLADWLGFVVALVALMILPGLSDPLTGPKLLVLSVGAFAAIPATVVRWRALGRSAGVLLIPVGAAALLLVWAILSTLLSGAPWSVSLYGWWGRGDGLLALASAIILLLAASTLDTDGIRRTITWLLWGSGIVAAIGLLEAVGVQLIQNTYPGVDATLGNPNFAAGYAAIMAVLAAARALEPGRDLWVRITCGVLAVALALVAYLTESLQGPAAFVAGLGAAWVIWVLAYRGPRRAIALAVTGALVVVSVALLALSLVDIGPLRILWADYTVQIRQQYWAVGWNMTTGLPIFGSGPDGFARYVSEFRPESYVELLGPVRRVSAAHNIALQFGATLGIVGLLLWLVVMGSLVVLLLLRAARAQIVPVMLVVGVGGAWTAYIVQGMVSIDMLPLLALGWLVTGLLIAALRGSPIAAEPPAPEKGKKGSRPAPTPAPRRTPTGVVAGIGGAIALVPLVLVSMQISAVQAAGSVQSLDQAREVLLDARTPCPLRVDLVQAVLQSDAGTQGSELVFDTYDLDPRCAPMYTFAAQVALTSGDLALADEVTAAAIEVDPLFSVAWLDRARYLFAAGDAAGARTALEEARRLDALYPEGGDAAPPDISGQVAELEGLISQAGG